MTLARIRSEPLIALFHEMRLGKTLTTIRWASAIPGSRLVVAPLAVLYAWERELQMENIKPETLDAEKRRELASDLDAFLEVSNQVQNGDGWYLINYEGLIETGNKTRRGKPKATPSMFAILKWQTIILDESACIRNPQAQRTKVCLEMGKVAKQRAVLSGLPNPEGPLDFFSQMQFVYRSFMGCSNYWEFRATHFILDEWGNAIPRLGATRLIRQAVRKKASVLSRKEVGLDNIPLVETRHVDFTPEHRKKYDLIERDFEFEGRETNWSVVKFNWMLQYTGGCPTEGTGHALKLMELAYLLRSELKGQQFLVWYQFQREGDAIVDRLTNQFNRYKVGRIAGNVSLAKRKRFQRQLERGEIDGLVLQVGCARYGLDLSAASVAIYYTIPSSHDVYGQSRDRIVHPKKKEPLLLVHLLVRNTIDDDIFTVLQDKRTCSRTLFRKRVLTRMRERREDAK